MSLSISNSSARKDLVTKALSSTSLERAFQYIGFSLLLVGILFVLLSAFKMMDHHAVVPGMLTGIGLIIGTVGGLIYGFAIRRSEMILREKKIAEKRKKDY